MQVKMRARYEVREVSKESKGGILEDLGAPDSKLSLSDRDEISWARITLENGPFPGVGTRSSTDNWKLG